MYLRKIKNKNYINVQHPASLVLFCCVLFDCADVGIPVVFALGDIIFVT